MWWMWHNFFGKIYVEKHKKRVHIGSDKPLSLDEASCLTVGEYNDIDNGPYKLRKKYGKTWIREKITTNEN